MAVLRETPVASANARVEGDGPAALKFYYRIRAGGGHYATAASCIAHQVIGKTGHDTTAIAGTEMRGTIFVLMRSDDHPDALIFAGPKIMLDESMSQDALKPFASDLDYPVFYMNYTLNPLAQPWKDSISRAVKVFRGTEYTITRPRDLWFSFSDLVSRIVKSKHGRGLSLAPVQ